MASGSEFTEQQRKNSIASRKKKSAAVKQAKGQFDAEVKRVKQNSPSKITTAQAKAQVAKEQGYNPYKTKDKLGATKTAKAKVTKATKGIGFGTGQQNPF
jgi:hypothetical protein